MDFDFLGPLTLIAIPVLLIVLGVMMWNDGGKRDRWRWVEQTDEEAEEREEEEENRRAQRDEPHANDDGDRDEETPDHQRRLRRSEQAAWRLE